MKSLSAMLIANITAGLPRKVVPPRKAKSKLTPRDFICRNIRKSTYIDLGSTYLYDASKHPHWRMLAIEADHTNFDYRYYNKRIGTTDHPGYLWITTKCKPDFDIAAESLSVCRASCKSQDEAITCMQAVGQLIPLTSDYLVPLPEVEITGRDVIYVDLEILQNRASHRPIVLVKKKKPRKTRAIPVFRQPKE